MLIQICYIHESSCIASPKATQTPLRTVCGIIFIATFWATLYLLTIYILKFSFIHIDTTQVVEILTQDRQELTSST